MEFWYTARGTFNNSDREAWKKYLVFSKLSQLTEVVSLDSMLNELVVEPDLTSADDWDFVVSDGEYFTSFFNSLDYVLAKTNSKSFNLLQVVKEPEVACGNLVLGEYEFIGYDLLDKSYDISALVNCGGFDNAFNISDLNHYGLIGDFTKAIDVNKRLLENNPEEYHADCNRFAIWRHKILGR